MGESGRTAGRILVVEDEPTLASLLKRYLARLGYEVDVCSSAAEALEQALDGKYRLVVADRSLPDMAGEELLSRLCEADAQLRAILLSGYLFELSSLPARCHERVRFLQKPFLPEALAALVSELST
ncbi:MAG: response regulator [Bryobacterales bacterium]|nr:response regulator [Bryobacterales bacterium]